MAYDDSQPGGGQRPTPFPAPDNPVTPRHYKDLTPEPINVIQDWRLNFNLGNAVKYIARAGVKGCKKTDLEKAIYYLQHELGQHRDNIGCVTEETRLLQG